MNIGLGIIAGLLFSILCELFLMVGLFRQIRDDLRTHLNSIRIAAKEDGYTTLEHRHPIAKRPQQFL